MSIIGMVGDGKLYFNKLILSKSTEYNTLHYMNNFNEWDKSCFKCIKGLNHNFEEELKGAFGYMQRVLEIPGEFTKLILKTYDIYSKFELIIVSEFKERLTLEGLEEKIREYETIITETPGITSTSLNKPDLEIVFENPMVSNAQLIGTYGINYKDYTSDKRPIILWCKSNIDYLIGEYLYNELPTNKLYAVCREREMPLDVYACSIT